MCAALSVCDVCVRHWVAQRLPCSSLSFVCLLSLCRFPLCLKSLSRSLSHCLTIFGSLFLARTHIRALVVTLGSLSPILCPSLCLNALSFSLSHFVLPPLPPTRSFSHIQQRRGGDRDRPCSKSTRGGAPKGACQVQCSQPKSCRYHCQRVEHKEREECQRVDS